MIGQHEPLADQLRVGPLVLERQPEVALEDVRHPLPVLDVERLVEPVVPSQRVELLRADRAPGGGEGRHVGRQEVAGRRLHDREDGHREDEQQERQEDEAPQGIPGHRGSVRPWGLRGSVSLSGGRLAGDRLESGRPGRARPRPRERAGPGAAARRLLREEELLRPGVAGAPERPVVAERGGHVAEARVHHDDPLDHRREAHRPDLVDVVGPDPEDLLGRLDLPVRARRCGRCPPAPRSS